MTKIPLSKDVYDAIKAGFSLSEMEVYAFSDNTNKSLKKYLGNPAVAAHPEAFLDGVALRKRVCFIFSADTMTDYNNDIASYDAKAKELNEKYGDIVLTADQVEESGDGAYGLVGNRVVPFAQITTTEFPSGETTVEFPQNDVDNTDAKMLSELEFTEK